MDAIFEAIKQFGKGYLADKPGTYNKGLAQYGEAAAFAPTPLIVGSMGLKTALKAPKYIQAAIKALSPAKKIITDATDWDTAVDIYKGGRGSIDDIATARGIIMKEAQRQLIPQEIFNFKGDTNKIIDLVQKRIKNEGLLNISPIRVGPQVVKPAVKAGVYDTRNPQYKSMEEFVKAQETRVRGVAPELQGQTLYRGMSEAEWQAIQAGGVSGRASKGGRTFLTTGKQTADMAVEAGVRAGKGKGVVVELKPEAGQKVISGGKIGENTGGNLPGEYQARDIGIGDIARVTDKNGKVIYEATTGGKTKSQLTDIWNQSRVAQPTIVEAIKELTNK